MNLVNFSFKQMFLLCYNTKVKIISLPMSKIKRIEGREILDSRGNPTVEVEVELDSGIVAVAGVPSGASTGKFEALELRDDDPKRFGGKGVLKAVSNVNEKIQKELVGVDVFSQRKIDEKMKALDGTENKSNLGANAILGVSLAVARAAAMEKGMELYEYVAEIFEGEKGQSFKIPIPMFNVVNGGMHSDSGLSIQEYKIVPKGIEKFSEQYRAGSEVFHALQKVLSEEGFSTAVGDEGGFAPRLESNAKALETINKAISEAGYIPGKDVFLGIDAAASSFFDEETGQYSFKPENVTLSKDSLGNIYAEWIEKYNVISVEDGLDEEDWEGWKSLNEKIGQKVLTIGDDLLVTNMKRLEKAIQEKACNSILIKLNQIGTLSETLDCIALAKKNDMRVVVSHRSGETTDDFIADLAVGAFADFIKSGSLSRGERICKYNRLLRISEKIS